MTWQAGLGAAGAIVGNIIAPGIGGSIGYAIGATAGGYLDRANADPIRGPRMQDLNVSASTYGLPIPRIRGTRRLPGNMIWSTGLIERENESGGKGGDAKGPRRVDYEYAASFAMAFCEGPCDAVLRIWMDGQLAYDATGTGEELAVEGLVFRFHRGDEEQLPDPAIVAHVGEEDAPYHRGLCYIVFDNVPLRFFGNRIPQVSAEIAAGASSAPVLREIAPHAGGIVGGRTLGDMPIDWDRKLAYVWGTVSGEPGLIVVDLVSGAEILAAPRSAMIDGLDLEALDLDDPPDFGHLGGSAEGGAVFYELDDALRSVVVRADPTTLRQTGTFGRGRANNLDTASFTDTWEVTSQVCVVSVPGAAGPRTFVCGSSLFDKNIKIIDGDNLVYVFGAKYWRDPDTNDSIEINHRFAARYTDLNGARAAIVPGAQRVTIGQGGMPEGERDIWWWNGPVSGDTSSTWDVWRVTLTAAAAANIGDGGVVTDEGIVSGLVGTLTVRDLDPDWDWFDPRQIEYDHTDDTFIIAVQRVGATVGPAGRVVKWSPTGGVVWNVAWPHGIVLPAYGNSRVQGQYFGLIADEVLVLDTRTGATAFQGAIDSSVGWGQAWDSRSASLVYRQSPSTTPTGMVRAFFFRYSAEGAPLAEVVRDWCLAAGLEEGDVDASELVGVVRGFASGVQSVRADLEQLQIAYQFDGVEEDGRIVFRHRGGAPVTTIAYDDLVRADERPALPERREATLELPKRGVVHYLNAERGQQSGAQPWGRTGAAAGGVTDANGEGSVDLSQLVLTPDEAKTIARRWVLDSYLGRWQWSPVRLPPKYIGLVPSDAVTLTMRDGSTVRARIERADIGADYTIEVDLRAEDAVVWSLTAEGDGGSGAPGMSVPAPYLSRLLWPEMPLLTDSDDLGGGALRSYAAAGGYPGQNFLGASLYYSTGDETWTRIAVMLSAATWGTILSAPAAPASPWRTDRLNTVRVSISSGASRLAPVTRAQLLNHRNLAALISVATGAVELIAFQDVEEVGDGTFVLSTLLRGCRGTDWACGMHTAGDLFLLLSSPEVQPLSLALTDLGATRYAKLVGQFDVFDAVAQRARVAHGEAEKPYSPVRVRGERDASGNLTITWLRRTRIGGPLAWRVPSVEPPLGEAAEEYEVDILDGDTVVRTIAGLTEPSCAYSVADQTSDFGSPQSSVSVRVYQVSAVVGRGRPREATV